MTTLHGQQCNHHHNILQLVHIHIHMTSTHHPQTPPINLIVVQYFLYSIWIITVAHLQMQSPVQWLHKKEMIFLKWFLWSFTGCKEWTTQAFQQQAANASWKNNEAPFSGLMMMMKVETKQMQHSTNRHSVSHGGAFECCRLKPTTYVAGIKRKWIFFKVILWLFIGCKEWTMQAAWWWAANASWKNDKAPFSGFTMMMKVKTKRYKQT